jgi:hypothetical protein
MPLHSTNWIGQDRTKHRPKSLILKTVTQGYERHPDMCKAVDRGMTITDVRVLEKHGGKSGDWVAA